MFSGRRLLATLGCLLLVAAAIKGWSLLVAPPFISGWMSEPVTQFALVELEVGLGLWLLSGFFWQGSLLAALVTLSAFATVNVIQGFAGQESCGCFGRIQVSPWLALLIDAAAFTVLGVAFRQYSRSESGILPTRQQLGRAARRVGAIGLGAAAISSLLLIIAVGVFGSARAGLAHLRGDRISVDPGILDLGDGKPGETRTAKVVLTNWNNYPVTFIGGVNDCACWVTKKLPITIPPNESRTVEIDVFYPPVPGRFRRTLSFLTNDSRASTVRFQLAVECMASASYPVVPTE